MLKNENSPREDAIIIEFLKGEGKDLMEQLKFLVESIRKQEKIEKDGIGQCL